MSGGTVDVPKKYKTRLFVGEGNFTGVLSLLEKHMKDKPGLGRFVVATELRPLDKQADKVDIESRIAKLEDLGVTVVREGYDATSMHTHPATKDKTFKRIHWVLPNTLNPYPSYENMDNGTADLVLAFFRSASRMQNYGDRVHLTITAFIKFQSDLYNLGRILTDTEYYPVEKRPWPLERYEGYTATGYEDGYDEGELEIYNNLQEYIFEKATEKMRDSDNRFGNFRAAPVHDDDGHTFTAIDCMVPDWCCDHDSSSYDENNDE
eukprot:TRINITY_DN590_c0_g2_i1.p1 TRINITY_DN590_c0_g2~~TRINITY_DN590_c0_g2_i1.p1  ORF type:complete len:276 (+),score=49.46 TRINITY_DN590_c0_g2_i1:37-828(+)